MEAASYPDRLILLIPAAVLLWGILFARQGAGWRVAFLQSLVVCSAAVVLWTESMSLCDGLTPRAITVVWSLLAAVALAFLARGGHWPRTNFGILEAISALCILTIAGYTAATAWLSPPNSADAMSYHLPRVVYWIQQRSVAAFPSSYLPQVMLQPVAEFLMLQTMLLADGDWWVNFVPFTGFFGSVAGVSAIAATMRMGRFEQCASALLCATLPSGILQASGAKNDTLLALWLVCAVLFMLRWRETQTRADLLCFGLSCGLALGTKGTAYLFLPPMVAAAWVCFNYGWQRFSFRQAGTAVVAIFLGTLLINLPQYARNVALSSSPLGFDSAHGDGLFRWRNERWGLGTTISNAARHLSEQLGARSTAWNQGVYENVLELHSALGLDPNDPATTWRWTRYRAPVNSNHEADANNRWHLLVFALALVWAGATNRRLLIFGLGPAVGWLLFCAYLKWQPTLARTELPLFVASAPLGGWLLGAFWSARWRRARLLPAVILIALASNTRLALTQNWTRPLRGEGSLLYNGRDYHYFNDLGAWNSRADYMPAIQQVAQSGCEYVGIDIDENPIEYPFQALLRQRNGRIRFVHVRQNEAIKGGICAVFCPDCADGGPRARTYAAVGRPLRFGRVLLFLRH